MPGRLRWLLLSGLVLALSPAPSFAQSSSRCPATWFYLQQQTKAAQQAKQQQQVMQEMQRQAQINKMRLAQQVPRMTPQNVAQPFTPNRAMPTPAMRTTQFTPPRAAIPRVTTTTTTTPLYATKMHSVSTMTHAVAMRPVTATYAVPLTAGRGIDTRQVGVVKNQVGVATRHVGVATRQVGVTTVTRGVDTRTTTLMTSTRPPTVAFAAPQSRTVGVTKNLTAPVSNPIGPRNLLPDPVPRPKGGNPLAKKPAAADPNLPLIKMNFGCVQCHQKMKIDVPQMAAKPPLLPTGLQKPRPALPAPIAANNCPPTPIAGPRLRAPVANNVPMRLPNPIGMPALRPTVLPRPWSPGQPTLPVPIYMPIAGTPTFSTPYWNVRLPGMNYQDPLSRGAVRPTPTSDKKRPSAPFDWTVPSLPATTSPGELPPEPTAPRPAEETPVSVPPALPKVTPIEGDGPTLPKLPSFALILKPHAPWSGEARKDDWYAAQPIANSTRAIRASAELDSSRPALPPVPARVLLPF